MNTFLASVKDNGVVEMGIFFGGMFSVAIVAIIADALRKSSQTKAREESRREIAAYVAEGSIAPDDAAKLLSAGGSLKDQLRDKIKEKLG
jgi:hypothetical protein